MKALKFRVWLLLALFMGMWLWMVTLEVRLNKAEYEIGALKRENEKTADIFDQVAQMLNTQQTLNDFFMSHCEKAGI